MAPVTEGVRVMVDVMGVLDGHTEEHVSERGIRTTTMPSFYDVPISVTPFVDGPRGRVELRFKYSSDEPFAWRAGFKEGGDRVVLGRNSGRVQRLVVTDPTLTPSRIMDRASQMVRLLKGRHRKRDVAFNRTAILEILGEHREALAKSVRLS